MYLLYLDDSGSVQNASDRNIVLAGVAVFERQPHWFSSRLETIAGQVWPGSPSTIEFRGTDILSGKKHWRGVGREDRIEAYKNALRVLGASTLVHLFGAVVHKAAISPADPMEYAFEEICNRFDRFLGHYTKLEIHSAG